MRGVINVSWWRSSSRVQLNVSLPVGVETLVSVPSPEANDPTCAPPSATILEGADGRAQAVWRRGIYVAGVPGVSGATAVAKSVELTVESGVYSFLLECA